MPTWIVRFDEKGRCVSPLTRAALISELAGGAHRQIIYMSHGWNSDFGAAIGQYQAFLQNFETVMAGRPQDPGFAPIFVGVAWPSVWFPIQEGPTMAGAGAKPADALANVVAAVASGPGATRLTELMGKGRLSRDEVREAVDLAFPALSQADDVELPGQAAHSPEEIVRAVAQMQAATQPPDLKAPPGPGGARSIGEAQVAAGLNALDPRNLARLMSLWRMKDRAGKVGAGEVSDLLRELLGTGLPVHQVGHSFGCKVMLSALTRTPPARPAASLLLLEPAISHLSFAERIEDWGPGGYLAALGEDHVTAPVLSTYSAGDFPLHDIFHLALRRPSDLGDVRIATTAGEPPSLYCALGGYGPHGAASQALQDPILKPFERYDAKPDLAGKRLLGLDGSSPADYPAAAPVRRIKSHGDVASPYTGWALCQQMGF